jgi:SAM-dependent methyltransferase
MNSKMWIAAIRGVLTNILAGLSPKLYMKLTRETGRCDPDQTQDELEAYCLKVVDDYSSMLKKGGLFSSSAYQDKIILEYGPGDFLGVALLFICQGAKRVYCIDRFSLRTDEAYKDLYNQILAKHALPKYHGITWNDIIEKKIVYITAKDGVHVLPEDADIVVSRAVLEHSNNLEKTIQNMHDNLKKQGLMIHKVDLTSHNTHLEKKMDFLCYPKWVWSLMTSGKGYPNRWRKNMYTELLGRYSFEILFEECLYEFEKEELNYLKPHFAKEFRQLPDDDLIISDYFFMAKKM